MSDEYSEQSEQSVTKGYATKGDDGPVPVVDDNQVNDPPQELDDSEATMDKDDKEAISQDNILSDESEVGTRGKQTGSYAEPGDEDEFTATSS